MLIAADTQSNMELQQVASQIALKDFTSEGFSKWLEPSHEAGNPLGVFAEHKNVVTQLCQGNPEQLRQAVVTAYLDLANKNTLFSSAVNQKKPSSFFSSVKRGIFGSSVSNKNSINMAEAHNIKNHAKNLLDNAPALSGEYNTGAFGDFAQNQAANGLRLNQISTDNNQPIPLPTLKTLCASHQAMSGMQKVATSKSAPTA